MDPSTPELNTDAEAFQCLTLNVSTSLSSLLKLKAPKGLTFSMFANNLLESDTVYQPDMTRGGINTVPFMAGRAFYFTLKAHFL